MINQFYCFSVDLLKLFFCYAHREKMATNSRKAKKKSPRKAKTELKLSRTHLPDGLTAVEWQRRLRRQFGRVQQFGLVNQGTEKFFSDFKVVNPVS
ncbi:MAG: hypothetical protein KDC37_01635, partial [Flavobacteriales bacterium]|nr:hypothetical protein [Flavobacteriales bacterium]